MKSGRFKQKARGTCSPRKTLFSSCYLFLCGYSDLCIMCSPPVLGHEAGEDGHMHDNVVQGRVNVRRGGQVFLPAPTIAIVRRTCAQKSRPGKSEYANGRQTNENRRRNSNRLRSIDSTCVECRVCGIVRCQKTASGGESQTNTA